MSQHIEEQLKEVPDRPGVYMMKNELDHIIYVGKARSLRKRIRSYFRKGNQTYKTRVMVDEIDDFDFIITDTEVEAYILEANLIKKYHPRYNVRLKDDKTYPYIKVTVHEDFPRIFKTRLVKNDGSRYFGPFASVDAIYKTLDVFKDLFSLRTCKKDLQAGESEERACLNYHIEKCLGPCIGEVSREEYRKMVDQVCLFLSGRQEELISRVEEMMEEAAGEKNFEKAARFRDALQAFQEISREQKVMSEKNVDQDIFALYRDEDERQACVQLLILRNGRLIGQEYFILEGSEGEEESLVMASFLQQYYEQAPQIPDEILLNTHFSQQELLQDVLNEKKGRKVRLHFPVKGNKKRLINMAESNAEENLKKEVIRDKYKKERTSGAVKKLQKELELEDEPYHIEGFDVSNIQGTDSVASMVVFKNGKPDKKEYRKFKIKSVEGADDFAMMQEVVERRYSRLLREERELPDLILIDGGKGQLSKVREVLDGLELVDQAVIGIAKREEEIFFPGKSEPVRLSRDSAALHLLQRVRDEAHRFAVNYHRKLRSRRLTHSMLDDIEGVGPERRKALLQHFGSPGEIKKANISKLKEVEGISGKTARKIYDYLRENMRAY